MTEPDELLDQPQVPLLREPTDGVPEPITTSDELAELAERMRAGHGPVAVDAERASGYRYSQRAYLIQLRRGGAGTALIDPIALPAMSTLNAALNSPADDSEWVLHAAGQDLPCLAEIGLVPARIFDTELAGRLLGDERVALGTMVEQHLGVRLEKGHSASDWSTRPLPRDWLVYAALDVELLVALRDVLEAELRSTGKMEWALQEFEAVRVALPNAPRVDPWRRTSGLHKLRGRRQLAAVRSLWLSRDEYASQRDVAPGRVLPDAAIIEAARSEVKSAEDLAKLPVFRGPRQKKQAQRWLAALEAAWALPEDELPPITGAGGDGMPPPARWRERDPQAADRLDAVRAVVAELAETHTVLAQNLLASDVVRRLSWAPPAELDVAGIHARLTELGARPWQIALTVEPLVAALNPTP